MKSCMLSVGYLLCFLYGCSQTGPAKPKISTARVGGNCEGCEAIYESPVSFELLPSTDTLPGFSFQGPAMEISGTIFKKDGKTPASGVVVYVYQTDQKGEYTPSSGAKGWEKRHGSIRGWVRSDEKGFYRFYTLRPASYPNSRNPQHIHVTVKEPDVNEYWIDEFQFKDDPLIGEAQASGNPRGGSGLVLPKTEGGLQKVTRNIILGLNVPGYE